MSPTDLPEQQWEHVLSKRLLDVLLSAALIGILAFLCYRIFAPFMGLMAWAIILAITLDPLQDRLARMMGGRSGWAAVVIVLLGILLLLVPAALLMTSLGETVRTLIADVQNNTLQIPPPPASVADWPLVGRKVHDTWTMASTDLPALVQNLQPQLGDLAKSGLAFVGSIGAGLLQFLGSLIIAGILMAYGESSREGSRAVFGRVAGAQRGEAFTTLCASTVRAVAMGVIGVAFAQALAIGIAMLIAGIPYAGVLAVVVLVLGIAQVPALIVTLPAIIYVWSSGHYATTPAIFYTILLFVAGMADNVLKPLVLGRGVEAPMPVILLGALGGMATSGILGMFVGATLLALGYQLFVEWVHDSPAEAAPAEPEAPAGVA